MLQVSSTITIKLKDSMMLWSILNTLFMQAKVIKYKSYQFEYQLFKYSDPESWRAGVHKYAKYITNYKHGNGFFCIPPYPYAGEVECFNFFVSN